MEQRRPSTPEERTAAIAGIFDDELKKIAEKIAQARDLELHVDTNGAVRRRQHEILNLQQRQAELTRDRNLVLGGITAPPAIRHLFETRIRKIDLEAERVTSHSLGVLFERGAVIGKEQELEHLDTVRTDMLRVGNAVLDILGEPPLVDKKIPNIKPN